MRQIPLERTGTWHARWRGCDHFHRAERTERVHTRAQGSALQKLTIDVGRVSSRVRRDEEYRRKFVRSTQPMN
jgi:hypothetical protein